MVSEITTNDIANYLRLSVGEYTVEELTTLISVAKAYIMSYTGLDETAIDTHNDFIIVIYMLCQDMYDNRSMYVDKNNLNKVVENILGMHRTNLLPTPESDIV